MRFGFALFAIGLAALVQAQLKPGITLMQASSALLTDRFVRLHLKMSKAQIAEVESAFKWYVARAGASRKSGQTAASQLELKAADRALAVLDGPQKARLRQLGFQAYGPFAVAASDVRTGFGLSPAQEKLLNGIAAESEAKMRAVREERNRAIEGVPKPQNPRDKAQRSAYLNRLRSLLMARAASDRQRGLAIKRAADRKVLQVFTAVQRRKWFSMVGARFPLIGRRA